MFIAAAGERAMDPVLPRGDGLIVIWKAERLYKYFRSEWRGCCI